MEQQPAGDGGSGGQHFDEGVEGQLGWEGSRGGDEGHGMLNLGKREGKVAARCTADERRRQWWWAAMGMLG